MGSKILLVVGVILITVGVIVSQSNVGVRIQGRVADPETATIARYAIGGGVGGLGLILGLVGMIGLVRGSRRTKQNQHLMQTGVDAEGTVTFVDKNYALLVNEKPIYSILEYTYRDSAGNQHTRRLDRAPSDFVIRKQIQVGAKVAIKYSAQNPSESVILLM